MNNATNPLRYFDSSLEVIRLVMLMYDHYPTLRCPGGVPPLAA
jgi:hypothetical protein